jgi:hypothetical protein
LDGLSDRNQDYVGEDEKGGEEYEIQKALPLQRKSAPGPQLAELGPLNLGASGSVNDDSIWSKKNKVSCLI